ncbi:MAG: hypothetical protein CMJ18_20830 [Phycisphaeraceae bacterium]|nr:hypothetical protein [Phycisphaeraceae bacterium]
MSIDAAAVLPARVPQNRSASRDAQAPRDEPFDASLDRAGRDLDEDARIETPTDAVESEDHSDDVESSERTEGESDTDASASEGQVDAEQGEAAASASEESETATSGAAGVVAGTPEPVAPATTTSEAETTPAVQAQVESSSGQGATGEDAAAGSGRQPGGQSAGQGTAPGPSTALPLAGTGSESASALTAGGDQVEGAGARGVGNAAPTPAAAPAAGGPEEQTNVARVVRALNNAVQQQGGMITMRLHPPELGVMRIEMQMNENTVRVALLTEQESVRHLLQQQIGQLRQALEGQGLQVERLNVQTFEDESTATRDDSGRDQETPDGRSRGAFDQEADPRDQGDRPSEAQELRTFAQRLNEVA